MSSLSYRFMTLNVGATCDGTELRVKQGLRTSRIALSEVNSVYAGRLEAGAVHYEELVVLTVDPAGKRKVHRFQADLGQDQFHAMVTLLATAHLAVKDLRSLSREEAHRQIGATDSNKHALLVAMVLVPLLVGVAGSSLLRHGLDQGHAEVTATELADGLPLKTRNLTITQGVLLDKGLRETTSKRNRRTNTRSESAEVLMPLVPPDWKPSDEVVILLRQSSSKGADVGSIPQQNAYSGVVRDLWFEGLGTKERRFFEDELGLHLASNVKLVDLDASPRTDLLLYLLMVGVTSAVMAVVGVFLWRRNAASAAGKPAA